MPVLDIYEDSYPSSHWLILLEVSFPGRWNCFFPFSCFVHLVVISINVSVERDHTEWCDFHVKLISVSQSLSNFIISVCLSVFLYLSVSLWVFYVVGNLRGFPCLQLNEIKFSPVMLKNKVISSKVWQDRNISVLQTNTWLAKHIS